MKSRKRKKRRVIWIIILIVLIAFSVWVYWENTSIQATQISISSKKIPKSFDGFTIVQVSDLHNAEFGDDQNRLLSAIKDVSPDIITVTGDLIDSRHTDIKKAMKFLNGAVAIAPVYYVTGNHEARVDEYTELETKMTNAGVIVLRDESTTLELGGNFISLLGLDDPSFTMKEDTSGDSEAMICAKLEDILSKENGYTILLSHRPEFFDVYVENGIDLVLSGHAHGGQIRLPFIGGLVAPNQGLFPQYYEGVYKEEQTTMIVSRGLGNSIIPVRINNRPELIIVTLTLP